MNFPPKLISSAVVLAFTCFVTAAAYYYRKRTTEINEVMIFCKLQYNPHEFSDKIVSYLENAKYSINVCMPDIKNPVIQDILLKLIKINKIKTQIIIEQSTVNSSSEMLIEELIDAGASIKYKTREYGMHHKFCLIDDNILMTGTLDWGEGNYLSDEYDYVYVTNKPQLVQPVKEEFYKMWHVFQSKLKNEKSQTGPKDSYPKSGDNIDLNNEIPMSSENDQESEVIPVIHIDMLTNKTLVECGG